MAYGKRYFFDFNSLDTGNTSNRGATYTCEIHKLGYAGAADEILKQRNPVSIDYPNSSKNKLEALRGSNALLKLIATTAFGLADLYSEDERTWLLKVYRTPYGSSQYLFWTGFILPDLCEEEFSFAPYPLEVNAVDGIGILKNLNFVQENGLHFSGKMSFKDVIWNCLNRLQIPGMALNTSVNIYWSGLTPADITDPLAETFVSTERYFKDDESTPMTCDEVLKSVLDEWTACIVQMNGHWYVYRPNEIAVSGTITFRQYSPTDGSYTGIETLSLDKVLGGESQGELIYHVDRSQRKSIAKPYKNATLSYKYGEMRDLDEELDNSELAGAFKEGVGDPIGPRADIVIPGWSRVGTIEAGVSLSGDVIFYPVSNPDVDNYYQNDNVFTIGNNFRLRLTVDYTKVDPAYYSPYMNFQIIWNDGVTNWYLQADYTWASVIPYLNYFSINSEINSSGQLVITSAPTTSSGTITIRILSPSNPERAIIYTSVSAEIYQDQGIQIGDIYVVTQSGKFTYVPDIINVFQGDSLLEQYTGALYKNDQATLTSLWNRRGITESADSTPFAASKPFLRIAVEEILRLHQTPMNVYDGTVAGFFPYLTRFEIRDLSGVYLPVQLSYDLQENTISASLVEVTNNEIENEYELQPDYGSLTKVSINGMP